jgi:uncharacterized protein (TIGR03437 family)
MRAACTVVLLCLVAAALPGQMVGYSTYVGGAGNRTATRIAADSNGYVYVTGATEPPNMDVFVAKLDREGGVIYDITLGGSAGDRPSGIAVDASGNAYVVGDTDSSDFPTLNALQKTRPGANYSQAFVAKLNPAGLLVYSTYLGGRGENSPHAVAVDAAGNGYITGHTNSPDYPVTAGSFQTTGNVSQDFKSPSTTAFVTKLNAAGNALVYSTFLGGSKTSCAGSSYCAGKSDIGNAIAVDAAGNAYITGATSANDFPTTPGAIQKQCQCSDQAPAPFVTKLNAGGTALVYSTYLGGAADWATAIAADRLGNAYVTGLTENPQFPTTPGAVQTRLAASTDAFVTKIDPGGAVLVYSTYLGGSGRDVGLGIVVDPQGNAVVTGRTGPADFPSTTGTFNFVTQLNAQGWGILSSARFLNGLADAGIALDGSGNAYLLGLSSFVSRFDLRSSSAPSVMAMTSAATSEVAARVSPGELVSIYGFNLGPQEPAGLRLEPSGTVSSTLAGSRVFFDEIPAPLLYAQRDQINAVAPFGLARGPNTRLRVESGGSMSREFILAVVETTPEIFRSPNGYAAALNEDGSVNSLENPAAPGSIIVLYATGAGITEPASRDGRPATEPLPKPRSPITVEIDLQPVEVLYAGAAPGLVAGVLQFNVRLPNAPTRNGFRRVTLTAGAATSLPALLGVKSFLQWP